MSKCANLWAVGFDDTERATQFQDEITRLGWEKHFLKLLDVALAVRYPDGSLTLNGEPFPIVTNIVGHTAATFLAGLMLAAPPLTSAAVSAVLGEFGAARSRPGSATTSSGMWRV